MDLLLYLEDIIFHYEIQGASAYRKSIFIFMNLKFLQQLSVKTKIYFAFVLLSLFSISVYILVDITFFSSEANKIALQNGVAKTKERQQVLNTFLIDAQNMLKYLRNSEEFKAFGKNPSLQNKKSLEGFFNGVFPLDKAYMRIKFIDKNGYEKIKVLKEKKVKNNTLEFVARSDYFKKAASLKRNETGFSRIYLKNTEQGFSTALFHAFSPVYRNKSFEGVLMVDFSMDDFLKKFLNAPLYDIFICDNKGNNILYDKNLKNIKEVFPKEYENIVSFKVYQTNRLISRKLDLPVDGGLIMVLQLKSDYVDYHNDKKHDEIILTSIIVMILSLIASFIIVNTVQKSLLDKDKMIFEQNKLASMGQMLENIAHQWRQPLAHINSIVYSIDFELRKEKIEKANIEKELDEIETVTEYLSRTIDDFKEFLDVNKPKQHFIVQDSIKKTISIIKASFEFHNIKIDLWLDEQVEIYNYPNLLEQSLLSILNNAKDALVQRGVENPTVNIEVKEFKSFLEIYIFDNAGGIDKENLLKVFEPYFTTKGESNGTGLGLYISKMMIEDGMQGKIFVFNVQNGACFKILLNKE
jgi:signal transduction histidine kinase